MRRQLPTVLPILGVMLTLVLGVTLAAGPPAAARGADATASTLQIVIADIRPLAPVEASTLVVTASVSNLSASPVSALTLSLDNAGAAESRQSLSAFEAAPSAGGALLTSKTVPKGLAAGASATVTLDVPMVGELLHDPSDARVYELSVVATGATVKGGAPATLGVAGLPLPYFPTPISSPLRTALVIPVTALPDQGPVPLTGAGASQPPSPDLIKALTAPDGRLDKLLTVVQSAPPAGGFPGTQLTLAIDPALLDRVCALAGKCGLHPPVGTGVAASQIANTWLTKLINAVDSPDVTVVGLPYADADIGAMTAAGDSSAVVTLLREAGGAVSTRLPSATTNTDLQPLLPVDGLADGALATAARRAGSTVAVLTADAFAPAAPTATGPLTATASTMLSTDAGQLPVLLTDRTLEDMLSPAQTATASPRLQEQQLLAELAVITTEQPNDPQPRTVVLEAPRDWDVPTAFSTHLVDALGAVSYVASDSLETLEGAPGVARARAVVPPQPAAAPLPVSTVTTVDAAGPSVLALKAVAASPQAETISPPFAEGLRRMLSAWWRGPNATAGGQQLASITNDLTSTVGKVSVKGARHGVLLTGPSGKLPVQVRNSLNESIAIIVHVRSDSLDQVTGRDVPVRLPANTAALQVSVPITTRSTRDTSVTVQLLPQSDPRMPVATTTIQVRSTSVGKVAVGITATALTFLVLLIVFRAVRRLHARRHAEPAA